MNGQYRVIAGPYRLAVRYAEARGWSTDEYIIVVRGHQLAKLDPALILSIVTVKLHHLAERIAEEIQQEIAAVKALWPIEAYAAA